MKTITLVSILFFSLVLTLNAQERSAVDLRSNLGLYSGDLLNFYNEVAQNKKMEKFDITSVEGSPYLNNEFIKGELVTIDSVQYAGIPLRYNIYNDVIEFKKNDLELELNNNFQLLYAIIDDAVFVKAKNQEGYFTVQSSGPVYLLEKMNIRYSDAKAASGYRPATLPSFKNLDSDYYIQKKLGEEATVVKNEAELLEQLSDKKEELKVFIKNEKLKVSRGEDLVEIIEYYNSLVN